MSVFVNGEWRWYRPEWSDDHRQYVDRLRNDAEKMNPPIICSKCHERHLDPHINACASIDDWRNPAHEPDWGTS